MTQLVLEVPGSPGWPAVCVEPLQPGVTRGAGHQVGLVVGVSCCLHGLVGQPVAAGRLTVQTKAENSLGRS